MELLLIDGNNVLHRISGSVDPAATRMLLARLRGVLPRTVSTVFMLDGHPGVGGSRRERLQPGFDIRHSGSISADEAIVRLVRDHPAAQRGQLTVVTDDRALSDRVRSLGARTQRLAWLEQVIGSAPTRRTEIGSGRRFGADAHAGGDDDVREPWKAGRGATKKVGNPRRTSTRPTPKRRDSR